MKFPIGSLVRCWGRFYDLDDALADPTAVYVTVRDPERRKTTYQYGVDGEVVKDGTGEYYIQVNANKDGRYYIRWYSTGTNQGANEGSFYVEEAKAR